MFKSWVVATMQAGHSYKISKGLSEGDISSAVILEKREVKSRITLQDYDVEDTSNLIKMLSEKTVPEGDSCKAELKIDEKGWRLKPDPPMQCKRELTKVDELQPSTKRTLESINQKNS
ncbi:MAG: hypothetical protein L6N95_03180 [Candidatus Methylarchaceae archaeon HK01B]|nr:hypothetical protein [Candidatus Methylarchaceae archaeon HK02M1]MCP8318812.1 hypothetical protein [Candidatus Methylarchaceae archaeon HK01B]